MNLDEALSKDMELKTRFLGAIAGKQQLDVAAISKADSCGLGNWLYGEGERKYKFLNSLQAMHRRPRGVPRVGRKSRTANQSRRICRRRSDAREKRGVFQGV